jgi:hypothetical protein
MDLVKFLGNTQKLHI